MSQSGIPSGDDTLGAATFDLIFDDTKWAWVAPGVLDVITDLDQTVTGSGLPYTVSLSLSGGGTNVLRATVTNNPTVDVLIYGGASVIGGAPIEVIKDICFDLKPAALGKRIATGDELLFDPVTTEVFLMPTLLRDNELQRSCNLDDSGTSGASPSGWYGACSTTELPDGGAVLPVELSSFASVVEGESVILNWRTETETNNAGFSVEHADGEGQFSEIAFVDGHGTTTKAQAYSFRVSNLDVGLHRFRLRQIDFDGAFEYSEEIETVIELAELFRLSAAYPNPFNPSTTFELTVAREQQVHVTVVNTLGQNVRTLFNGIIEANETANFVFDAAALPTGLYFYSVRGETFAQTRQVMFVK